MVNMGSARSPRDADVDLEVRAGVDMYHSVRKCKNRLGYSYGFSNCRYVSERGGPVIFNVWTQGMFQLLVLL